MRHLIYILRLFLLLVNIYLSSNRTKTFLLFKFSPVFYIYDICSNSKIIRYTVGTTLPYTYFYSKSHPLKVAFCLWAPVTSWWTYYFLGIPAECMVYPKSFYKRPATPVLVVISFSLCVSKKWCAKKFRDHVTLYVNEVQGI